MQPLKGQNAQAYASRHSQDVAHVCDRGIPASVLTPLHIL